MDLYVKDGWKINPDEKIFQSIMKAIKRNNGECPCNNPYSGTEDAICPCKSYTVDNKCCCNLYVKNERI